MQGDLSLSVEDLYKEARQTGRVARRPTHTFQTIFKPFTIQPFMLAPVLPGETLKSLLLQSRAVSDPINNKLCGWWHEYFFFYVKMTDIDHFYEDNVVQAIFTDPAADLSSLSATVNFKTYHAGGTIDWANECLKVVAKEWFREDGEAWNVNTIDGMPAAKVRNPLGWIDSLLDETTVTEGAAPGAGETEETMEENYRNYMWLKANQITNMTYEDFCRTYGVKMAKAEEYGRPELIHHETDWQYPVNTVDPTSGVPTSAVSWLTQAANRKARLFKEPGFIFGVQVVRPKVYFGRVYGAGASMMDTGIRWFPAIMREDAWVSLREYAANAGPLNGDDASEDPTNGYIADIRDLLLYGDQFMNFENSATNAGMNNLVQLPTAALQKQYPAETDIDSFFVSGTAEMIRCDGVVSLNILGTQRDHTPRPSGGA